MLIYIEGVDLTGKSTLATELSTRCAPSAPVVHHRGRPLTGCSVLEYVNGIDWYRPDRSHDLIVDRGWLSEIVYSEVYGRPTDMTDFKRGFLRDWYAVAGCQYVLCVRDLDELVEENQRACEPLSPTQLRRAFDLYYEVVEEMALPYQVYDFTAADRAETIENTIGTARAKQRLAAAGLSHMRGG